MKISIFSSFYPFRGGIAQFNAELFKSYIKIGIKPTAFTFIKQYPNFLFPGKSQYVTETDKVEIIPAKRVVSSFNPFTYFSASKKINASHPDIFIANYWISIFSIFIVFIGKRLSKNTKKVGLVHNLIPHEPRFFDKWFNSYFIKHFDGFVAMSDKVQNDILSIKPTAKILRIDHPWYNHFGDKMNREEASLKLSLDPTKKTLLFFGLIREYKGLDLLIEAFDQLDDNYQLIIAGEFYSKKEKYLELIQHNRNRERILLSDRYISDDEVSLFFSAADVCILPYRSATQSGVTAAAFNFEIPVIATNVGGLKQTVLDKNLGLIINDFSSITLANTIISFFSNDLAKGFREEIKKQKENHSWDQFATEIIRFAKEL